MTELDPQAITLESNTENKNKNDLKQLRREIREHEIVKEQLKSFQYHYNRRRPLGRCKETEEEERIIKKHYESLINTMDLMINTNLKLIKFINTVENMENDDPSKTE